MGRRELYCASTQERKEKKRGAFKVVSRAERQSRGAEEEALCMARSCLPPHHTRASLFEYSLCPCHTTHMSIHCSALSSLLSCSSLLSPLIPIYCQFNSIPSPYTRRQLLLSHSANCDATEMVDISSAFQLLII